MEYIVNRIKKELGFADCKVIATGGYADIFAEETESIQTVDTALTLKGLQIVFDD